MSNRHELEAARESYFAAGGIESDIGPRDDAEWYWRRAAKLWRFRAMSAERKLDEKSTKAPKEEGRDEG